MLLVAIIIAGGIGVLAFCTGMFVDFHDRRVAKLA